MKTDTVLRPHSGTSTADPIKIENFRWAARGFIALFCIACFYQLGWAQPVLYVGTNAATGLGQLRLINSDGTGDRVVPLALLEAGFPSFSKDGHFMALTSQTPGRTNQSSRNVFLLNLLTAQLSQVTQFEDQVSATNFAYALPWYHSLSPDSSTIAIWSFVRSRDGTVPLLQTYRVSDGLLLNSLFYNRILTGYTQGGNGVDWHPAQDLLVAAIDSDIPVYDLDTGAPLGTVAEGTVLIRTPASQPSRQQLTFPRGYQQSTINRYYFTGEADYVPAFSP